MPRSPEQFSSRNSESSKLEEAPTEDVIGTFAELAEHYREHHPATPAEREAAASDLHTALDKFENHEIKNAYDEGRVPTFESMERAASAAREALVATGDEEAIRIAKLLTGRVENIKTWARKYISSILRFRRSRLAHMRMNDQEQRDALEQADRDRRRIHDSLLEALSSLTRFIEEGKGYADYPMPMKEWRPSDILPRGSSGSDALIFSKEAIADRDLIRDWAIVADRIEEIRKIIQEE